MPSPTSVANAMPKEDEQKRVGQTVELEREDFAAQDRVSEDVGGEDTAFLRNPNQIGQARQLIAVTFADNKRILRKIDLTILPIMLSVYFLQALDKATLSYASIFGLIEDAHLSGEDYSWLGSIVYIAQLVLQPVIAFFLVKLPTGKFAAVMVLCWGIVLSFMAVAKDFKGLLITRFFLGAFEASIAPTFIAISQMWWRRQEQTNRNSLWYSMNGVTNMVGSLIAWGLGHIHSPVLFSYQIIFLTCGLTTVIFSLIVFFFMPDSPHQAKFLTEPDKLIAVERLKANRMGIRSTEWKWAHVTEAFLDFKTYFWFALIFSISVPSGGITTFGPLIVQNFGFDSFHTILLNIPFGAVQIVATLGGAAFATYTKLKGAAIALLCVPPIIGCLMLLFIDHTTSHRAPLLVGYYLISVYPGITPLIYSWSSQNTAGETKKKTTTAVLFIGQSAGNILGPHLYTTGEAPKYVRGLVSNLALFCLLVVGVCATTIYLMLLNRSHGKKRLALGKSAEIIDRSMMEVEEQPTAEDEEDYSDPSVNAERVDNDETDMKNEDFIYVY